MIICQDCGSENADDAPRCACGKIVVKSTVWKGHKKIQCEGTWKNRQKEIKQCAEDAVEKFDGKFLCGHCKMVQNWEKTNKRPLLPPEIDPFSKGALSSMAKKVMGNMMVGGRKNR